MLSFHIVQGGKAIQIYCDQEGMGVLNATLAKLVTTGPGHVHLWNSTAGGSTLSDASPWGEPGVAEVIIDYCP